MAPSQARSVSVRSSHPERERSGLCHGSPTTSRPDLRRGDGRRALSCRRLSHDQAFLENQLIVLTEGWGGQVRIKVSPIDLNRAPDLGNYPLSGMLDTPYASSFWCGERLRDAANHSARKPVLHKNRRPLRRRSRSKSRLQALPEFLTVRDPLAIASKARV